MGVGLLAAEQALLAQFGDDRLLRLRRPSAPEALGRLVGDEAVLADGRERLEAVLAPDLEVVGIVAGRDLERAGAELDVHVLVRDHRHLAADQRQHHVLADRVLVALVTRVHGHRDVREHRLRAHRRDDQLPEPSASG